MPNAELLPLALLYVDGGRPVDGITRFQKLVFLAQEETELESVYEFESDKYGPFSSQLYKSIDSLEERNIIQKQVKSTRSNNEKFVYSLTPKGRSVVRELLSGDEGKDIRAVFDISQEMKKQHNYQPLNRLLRYVYNNYEDYTTESELNI